MVQAFELPMNWMRQARHTVSLCTFDTMNCDKINREQRIYIDTARLSRVFICVCKICRALPDGVHVCLTAYMCSNCFTRFGARFL